MINHEDVLKPCGYERNKRLGLKQKIILLVVGLLVLVTLLDSLLASYFTQRQNQQAAFSTLKRELWNWQDELQVTTKHMRSVALSAIGENVALNQLAEIEVLEYKLEDALNNGTDIKEAARTLAFSKTASLNRLHLVLRSGGFSSIAVYRHGELSHWVSESEVGMFVRRGNHQPKWVKVDADDKGNLPIHNWPAWEEGYPPQERVSRLPIHQPTVGFAYSDDSMLIELAVPIEGIIEHFVEQGDLGASELSVYNARIAATMQDQFRPGANRSATQFAEVVFQKRIDRSVLQAIERKTGMWPILFSPDERYSQQLGPFNLSLRQLLPNGFPVSGEVSTQTLSIPQGSFYAAVLPWSFEQQPGFVLALVASMDSTLQNIRQTLLALLTVSGLILVFSITLGVFWLGRYINPIITLTQTVKAIGTVSRLGGDSQMNHRLQVDILRFLAVRAPDEVGDLAWAFDSVIRELFYSLDTLEQRVEERTSELLSLQQALEDRNLLLEVEISERKNIEALIHRQACYDSLTGLSNRRMLIDRLYEEAAKCNRNGSSLALLFIDLDRFKEVNDSLGHQLGDQLLVQVAERIRGNVRVSDIVARLAGDEFVVILPLAGDDARVGLVGQHIVAALTRPFQLEDSVAYISASIGIACYPEDTDDIDQLLGCADQSMYAVKKAGRNGLSFFTSALQDEAQQRLQLSNDLRNALSLGQLQVHYQPIVNLETLQVEKAEALVRWQHPERGMVRPDLFIPLAEETGLIHEIGDWVFKQAAETALNWQKQRAHESCQMSVNMSPRQFMRGDPYVTWIEHLKSIGLSPNAMVIEITEGLLLDDQIEVVDKLARFHRAGMQLALDDFGTGYSAMAYLKKFNIDYLKIDRSFVCDLEIDAGDRAIAEAIVVMAHKLGLKVIAEGVETEGQRALLAAAGCEYLQGYLYAKPMIDEDFLDYAMNFNGAI